MLRIIIYLAFLFASSSFAVVSLLASQNSRKAYMTPRRLIKLLIVLILSIGISTANLFAQGTDLGTIRGTVTDSSGALVPNARVDVTDLATLTLHTVTTNEHGDYQAAALPSGRYKVTVTAGGFGTSIVEGIVLTGSDTVTANAELRAAANATTVEVT